MTSIRLQRSLGAAASRAASGTLEIFPTDGFRRALFLLIVVNLSGIHQQFLILTKMRLPLVLTALVALYAVLNPASLASGSVLRSWPAKVVAGILLMACLSVAFGISMGAAGKFVLRQYLQVIVCAFVLIAAIRNVRDLYSFVWCGVVAGAVLSVLSIFFMQVHIARDDGFARLRTYGSYDPNDIGCIAIVAFALALLAFQTSKGLRRPAAVLVILALGMTIARTGSRGAFVAIVALGGALFVLLRNVSINKRVGFVLIAMLGLGVAAPHGYWQQMLTILTPEHDYNWSASSGRKELAIRGMKYMLSHPIAGIGISNFDLAEGTISDMATEKEEGDYDLGIKWSAAHNSFVQIGAELGIPGLALFCTLVFGGILGLYRLGRSLPKHWINGDPEEQFLYFTCVYLPVAFVGFAVAGFFVSFAYLDLIYVLAALAAGTYISVAGKLAEQQAGGRQAAAVPTRKFRGGLPPHPAPLPPLG